MASVETLEAEATVTTFTMLISKVRVWFVSLRERRNEAASPPRIECPLASKTNNPCTCAAVNYGTVKVPLDRLFGSWTNEWPRAKDGAVAAGLKEYTQISVPVLMLAAATALAPSV